MLTLALFWATPAGFVPAQDQGYALAAIQLPPGSSIERTDAVLKKAVGKLLKVPGVDEAVMFSGFDGASGTQASNAGAAYVTFDPFEERAGTDRTEQNIENDMRAALADMDEAFVFVIPPPVIQGIGNGGGYRMIVQDRSDMGYQALEQAGGQLIGAAHQDPSLANVFTLYNTATPRIWADIDRAKADMLGVPPARVFEALQVYLGSAYVNDFNLLGRTYRVTAQAEASARDDPSDIAQLKTRSNSRRNGSDRLGRDLQRQDRALSRHPLQSLPRGRGRRRNRARHFDRPGDGHDGEVGRRAFQRAFRPNGPDRLPAGSGGQHRHPDFRFVGGVRLPGARRPVRKPAAAAGDHPDRADDPAGGDGRREPARDGQ